MIIKKLFCKLLRYVVLLVPFLLTACWESDSQLFDESLMVDPFGRANAYTIKDKQGKNYVFIKKGKYFESPNTSHRYSFIPSHFKNKNSRHRYFIASNQIKGKDKTRYAYGYVDNKNAWHTCLTLKSNKVDSIQGLKMLVKAAFINEKPQKVCKVYGVAQALSLKKAQQIAKQIENKKNIDKHKTVKQGNVKNTRPQTNSHSHAGRVHSHPLPKQGFHHKHGNGAYGQSNISNKYATTTKKYASRASISKKSRLKNGVLKPPRVPANLNGFYIITENGGVYRAVQNGSKVRLYFELVNKSGRDAGRKRGDLSSIGTYSLVNSTLLLRNTMIIQNKSAYRHCGTMFAEKINYGIFPLRFKDGSYSPNVWQSQSRTGKYCVLPRTNRSSCRMVSCDRYEKDNSKSLFMKNRSRAIKIGSQRQRTYKVRHVCQAFLLST